MKSIHIRDVPSDTLERLKNLATLHHRSLQGELQAILAHVARLAPAPGQDDSLTLITVDRGGTSNWKREDIYGTEGR